MSLSFDTAIKLGGLIVASLGIATFFCDKHIQREAEERRESISLISEYSAPQLREDRRNLFRFWETNSAAEALGKAEVTRREYQAFMQLALASYGDRDGFYDSLYAVVNHFDKADHCVEYEICDEEVALSFYCYTVESYWKTYWPAIEGVRRNTSYSSFARGLQNFYERCLDLEVP